MTTRNELNLIMDNIERTIDVHTGFKLNSIKLHIDLAREDKNMTDSDIEDCLMTFKSLKCDIKLPKYDEETMPIFIALRNECVGIAKVFDESVFFHRIFRILVSKCN